ncbi:hypothetical protein C8R44DRAFT_430613 [Mycena epipterygia]|nr:hypothetical protein C8R44DRAFT_430613 [Mycena epipterygia]
MTDQHQPANHIQNNSPTMVRTRQISYPVEESVQGTTNAELPARAGIAEMQDLMDNGSITNFYDVTTVVHHKAAIGGPATSTVHFKAAADFTAAELRRLRADVTALQVTVEQLTKANARLEQRNENLSQRQEKTRVTTQQWQVLNLALEG